MFLDIIESDLDPRDVGQVSLERSSYLIRINESGTFLVYPSTTIDCVFRGLILTVYIAKIVNI